MLRTCEVDGHSLVLCHFRVGFVETCVLGQLEFQEGIEYELPFKVQKSASSTANMEVHVSGYHAGIPASILAMKKWLTASSPA